MAALTLSQMILRLRSRLDDTGTTGILWTDDELIVYLNNGEKEICTRALILKDKTTASVSEITTVIGTDTYPLHDTVIFVHRAAVDGETSKLKRISVETLDTIDGWEAKSGTPSYFSTDHEDGSILLSPVPDAIKTINLTVIRLPLVEMALPGDLPEINERYHKSIVDWASYEAYSKNDADTSASEKALNYYNIFESAIGKHQTAAEFVVTQRKYPKNYPKAASDSPGTQAK